jgi:branched-chain amino acid transport system substrate-binding protein
MLRRNFLAAGLAAPFVVKTGRAAGAEIPIGAIEILSGPNAAYGIAIRSGLELALAEVNGKGVLGGRKLTLTVEDSAGNKDQAINAARELIGRDKVIAIIGPTLSTEMFAVGPVTNARKIPIIGTSTTAVGITAIGPYVFRTSLPEADVVPVTLRYAMAHGVRSIAFLYANDDVFSKSSYDMMDAAAKKAGLKVLDSEAFGSRDTDFSAQLTKIKALKPDAVGIAALVEPTAGVLLQARALGFGKETLFIGGNGANSPKLGQIAGAAADGLIVGSPWFIGKQDPVNVAFVAAFRKKFGRDPDQFAAQAFDTLKIVAAAIDRAGAPDPVKLREALLQTDFNGVMGPFSFTPNRDPASAAGVVVLQMEGGAFRIAP